MWRLGLNIFQEYFDTRNCSWCMCPSQDVQYVVVAPTVPTAPTDSGQVRTSPMAPDGSDGSRRLRWLRLLWRLRTALNGSDGSRWNQRFEFVRIGAVVAMLGNDSEPWVRFRWPITTTHCSKWLIVSKWLGSPFLNPISTFLGRKLQHQGKVWSQYSTVKNVPG